MPRKVLYLATDSLTRFWECGLGRDLRDRYLDERGVRPSELEARHEYQHSPDLSGLSHFDSRDAAARRGIGAKTSACFQGEYATTQRRAEFLMQPWTKLDGVLYLCARQSSGYCLALFDSPAAVALIPTPRAAPLRNSFQNPGLLVALMAESVQI